MRKTAPPGPVTPFLCSPTNLSLAVVRLDDRARDAAALGHLVTVLVGPLADRLVLIAAAAAARGGSAAPGGPAVAATATHAGRGRKVGVQRLAQFSGVLLGQIDRVVDTVESEFDSAVRLASVEIIGKEGNYLLGHDCCSCNGVIG